MKSHRRIIDRVLTGSVLMLACLLRATGTADLSVRGSRLAAAASETRVANEQVSRSQHSEPPAESRILKIIHSWPDDPAAQDALIRSLANQRFGGVVCNVSFNDYLQSEAHWQSLTRALQEAKKAGFALWLYDEKGYPSGTAGGLTLRDHPEWEARGLLIADTESRGGPVALELPPGRPFLTAAFPVEAGNLPLEAMTNLATQVQAGRLTWTAPAGTWRVLAITESRLYEGTHASMSLADHIPYPNLLEPEPTARFLALTHQSYAEHLGNDLGRWFISTFTDEPSLMSLFLRPMPYRVLPWAPNLPAEFKRRRGYALEPLVPALIAEAGAKGRRARYDYWLTVGELVSENYFGQIQKWCAAHQVLSGGHLLMEENLVNQVPLYGDFFRCLRRLDAPSIDCLTSVPDQVPSFIARLAASAADLEGRTVTMCETSDHSQRYRPPGDKRPVRPVTEGEIRGTCNRLMVGGINTITSYYAFAGLAEEQLRRLNQWVGVVCAALKGGHQVTDLAVLYPTESIWPRFRPARHYANDSAAAVQVESIYHDVADGLFAAARDFTFVDARALAQAKVEAGVLVHGQLRWRVVILPGADTLPRAAWENVAQFVQSGGVLFALGVLPANSETEFPSARVQALASEIFGPVSAKPQVRTNPQGGAGIYLPAGAVGLLPSVLGAILAPDLKVADERAPLRYTHRQIDGQERFFVINDGAQPWSGSISLSASGPGEQSDPATGECRKLAQAEHMPLALPPYGGALFRFAAARLPQRFKINDSILPNLVAQPLPAVAPMVACGEFVREKLMSGASHTGRPDWEVTATVTRGQVDTYLFVRFAFPQGLDLSKANCLVWDTWVPAGQRTPTQLLAILHQKNGADYLASTGRLLGAPGPEQVCLPLSRFQLAGWSSDPAGHLELTSITQVSLGWGGYYGTEGETIEFGFSRPNIATSTPKSVF